jgi:hypothetical protein
VVKLLLSGSDKGCSKGNIDAVVEIEARIHPTILSNSLSLVKLGLMERSDAVSTV